MSNNPRLDQKIIKELFPHHIAANCKPDGRMLEYFSAIARKPTPTEGRKLRDLYTLAKVDWSNYLGFIRHQGNTSSCIMQATVACLDILKEFERAHSPNLSAWWLVYVYWSSCTHEQPYDPNFPTPVHSQGDVAITYGCCSEASYSSRVNLPPPVPGEEQRKEALLSKLGSQEPLFTGPSLDVVKGLLSKGPVWTMCGGHSMALVGYDDSASLCKFADSYGDRVDGGFRYWPYSKMNSLLPGMLVRPMINAATPADAFRYTGYVKLRHKISRRYVTVSVGVTGQKEVLIWPQSESSMSGDDSECLVFRFPLPSYAAENWPPGYLHKYLKLRHDWYVKVTEISLTPSSEIMGCVEEIRFYDRLKSVAPGGYCFQTPQDILRGSAIVIRPMKALKPKPKPKYPKPKKPKPRRPVIV